MSFFLRLIFLSVLIFSFATVPAGAYTKEQLYNGCLELQGILITKYNTPMNRSLDKESYCQCIVDSPRNGRNDAENANKCSGIHAREGFLKICQEEIAPLIKKKTNDNTDCNCVYNEILLKKEFQLEIAQKTKTPLTPQDEADAIVQALRICKHKASL